MSVRAGVREGACAGRGDSSGGAGSARARVLGFCAPPRERATSPPLLQPPPRTAIMAGVTYREWGPATRPVAAGATRVSTCQMERSPLRRDPPPRRQRAPGELSRVARWWRSLWQLAVGRSWRRMGAAGAAAARPLPQLEAPTYPRCAARRLPSAPPAAARAAADATRPPPRPPAWRALARPAPSNPPPPSPPPGSTSRSSLPLPPTDPAPPSSQSWTMGGASSRSRGWTACCTCWRTWTSRTR